MPENMVFILPVFTAVLAAIQAIHSRSLIRSALWLAGVSASLSVLFFMLGMSYVAAIELSVGAGLVTVLFVFAIGIAGAENPSLRPMVPKALAWIAALLPFLLLAVSTVPVFEGVKAPAEQDAAAVFWEQRGLDVVVQVVLIFCGVLGLLGVLAEAKAPLEQPMVDEIVAERERELRNIENRSDQAVVASLEKEARRAERVH